ncbi:unnamed protein product [Microthlaspi erraticum]|uniref:Mediator complex subunit 15 KIX domain-containing protein n=1 Tax=Microthlaspi erraticum TaxID=1685480 RepID=A0A6D2ICV6_9BRAS|nr:unnamed protein product [Microthlaspi erraticum]
MAPALQIREPTMGTVDWRTQLLPASRQYLINKILETIKKRCPFAGPEGLIELRRIAARFEEKIFNLAESQNDYYRKIAMKMLTFETSSLPIPPANNSLPLDSGHVVVSDNSVPSLPNEEPAVNTADWRTQLPPDSRQKSVKNIVETLKRNVPYTGQEGIEELMRIAASFEDLIFTTAKNQEDYFHKISLKMETNSAF